MRDFFSSSHAHIHFQSNNPEVKPSGYFLKDYKEQFTLKVIMNLIDLDGLVVEDLKKFLNGCDPKAKIILQYKETILIPTQIIKDKILKVNEKTVFASEHGSSQGEDIVLIYSEREI